MKPFRRRLSVALALAFLLLARPALPFCGFYVAKADTNKVDLPEYGMVWSFEGRNAIQSDWKIVHRAEG